MHLVSAAVSLSGSLSAGAVSISLEDLEIVRAFKISAHAPRAPKFTQVTWIPPNCGWVKCNTDGASRGNQVRRQLLEFSEVAEESSWDAASQHT